MGSSHRVRPRDNSNASPDGHRNGRDPPCAPILGLDCALPGAGAARRRRGQHRVPFGLQLKREGLAPKMALAADSDFHIWRLACRFGAGRCPAPVPLRLCVARRRLDAAPRLHLRSRHACECLGSYHRNSYGPHCWVHPFSPADAWILFVSFSVVGVTLPALQTVTYVECRGFTSLPSPLGSLCDNPSLRVIPRSRRRRGISRCLENTQSEIPRSALSKITALSPLGERVARCRRFHQPERAG